MSIPPIIQADAPKVLSICTGMGLMDRAFIDEGFDVVPGCEVDAEMRALYEQLCGDGYLAEDIQDMNAALDGSTAQFDGVIGGPPCQAHTRLRAMRKPKFPDLTEHVQRTVSLARPRWFVFENVAPVAIDGAVHVNLNAMHFAKPHQSRARWFAYSPNLSPPAASYSGTTNDLLAYPVVAGKIYGKTRAAILQGYPQALRLKGSGSAILRGLVNAVHYGVARAWAVAVRESIAGQATSDQQEMAL